MTRVCPNCQFVQPATPPEGDPLPADDLRVLAKAIASKVYAATPSVRGLARDYLRLRAPEGDPPFDQPTDRDIDTEMGWTMPEGDPREVLKALVEKLDSVNADPCYAAVWAMYHGHGGRYTGPNYIKELAAAKALLAPPRPPVPHKDSEDR